MIAAAAIIAVRNAMVYPAFLGYDAREVIDDAQLLVEEGRLPDATGSYYSTPPASSQWAGWESSSSTARPRPPLSAPGRSSTHSRGGRHAAAAARSRAPARAWAGRPASRGGRVFGRLPGRHEVRRDAPPRAAVHVALDRCARPRCEDPRPLRLPAARRWSRSGSMLGLSQLVRAWTLWTFGVVIVGFSSRPSTGARDRRPLIGVIAVVAAIAILVPYRGTRTRSVDTTAPCSGSRTPTSRSVAPTTRVLRRCRLAGARDEAEPPVVLQSVFRAHRLHRGLGRLLRSLEMVSSA